MTSLRETGEKILLPYPIRQPARRREFAFAVTASRARANVDSFQNYFCLASYHDCALNRGSVDFGQLGSLFQFNGESVLHLMEANRTTCIETCSAGRIVL